MDTKQATQDPQTLHTPEPWHIGRSDADIAGADEYGVAETDGVHLADSFDADRQGHWQYENGTALDRTEEQEATNARHIVACVNACAGFPTSALEAGMLDRLVTAAQDALTSLDALPHTTITVSGVSQHLRAALRALEGHDA